MFRVKGRSKQPAAEEPAREVSKPDEQWKADLSRQQYNVLRHGHTEMAFTGTLLRNKKTGSYVCAGCGAELFRSDAKFDSGTGWPSFFQAAAEDAVELRSDYSMLMRRTEVLCRRCGGHLGHVFRDGPRPTGQRYCINSAALDFEPTADPAAEEK